MVEVVARILQGVEFLRLGLATNFWGLGCPAHCGSPAWPTIFLSLIIGIILGFFLCLLCIYYLLGLGLVPPATPSRPSSRPVIQLAASRLRGDLHER